MTFKEYQKRSYTAIQPHTDHKDEVLNWGVGLAEEVGEVMNHIKHAYWGNEPIDKVEMAKELGDVLWYTAALATSLGINLATAATLNVEKLEHRFGGGDFSESQSKARHSSEQKFSTTERYFELMEELEL